MRPANYTDQPPGYQTPPFPSLYWLVGPSSVVHPAYLYNWRDIWRFTFWWTFFVYEGAFLLVSLYSIANIWWGGQQARARNGAVRKGRRWGQVTAMWAVPLIYIIIGGIEAVVAGSTVGLV